MSQSRSLADTPRRTPVQSRSYLPLSHGLRHSPHPISGTQSPHIIHQTNSMISQDGGLIFGTNVSTTHVMQCLQNFIMNFQVVRMQGRNSISERIYHQKFNDLSFDIGQDIFEVQGVHLKQFDRQIYFQFVYFPAQMISCFDFVLKSLYQKYFINDQTQQIRIQQRFAKKQKLMIGITHLDQITFMRNLTPKDINKLICFRGIVIRCSQIYPQMKAALFKCTHCKTQTSVILQNAKVQQPTQCQKCKHKNTLQLIHNLCSFTDKQYIKFQQLPQCVPDGETPNSVTIISYDNNVDGMRPGDRVQLVGIYRAHGVKVRKSRHQLKSIFNTYVDLISFNIIEDNRYKAVLGDKSTVFSDDQRLKFSQMANKQTIIEDLVDSFASSIYGHTDIKKGILTQLFGGARKDFSESGRGRFRSDINICLVGDPSTAKSQLLQQVYKIAPRGIYTSGRGSSAVGLTANVRKDPQTRQFILQSGALVLSDLGICCIDEFDKMDDNSKTILLEAMQQQTISVAKAGIVCQLNSRTAILAAANPVNSKYSMKKSVIENINLNPALLSRFDLIYIMLDSPNEQIDKRLASHILDIYSNKQIKQLKSKGYYPKQLLAKFITYARQYVTPKLSQAAGKRLSAVYLQMRKLGNNKKIISATPRQLQSLIRLSQAFAKMRLSIQVIQSDVQRAIDLMRKATQHAATDPETGLIDMDAILTGKTTASRMRVNKIKDQIKKLIQGDLTSYRKTSSFDYLGGQLQRVWNSEDELFKETELLQALRMLESESYVTLFGHNKSKPNFKLVKQLLDE